MRIENQTLVSGPTAVTTTFISKAIYLGHIADYAIQLSYSGTGSIKLQASCDDGEPRAQSQAVQERGVTNYSDVAGSTKALSGTDTVLYDVANCGYNWVRVVITGTVTINTLRFNLKGI